MSCGPYFILKQAKTTPIFNVFDLRQCFNAKAQTNHSNTERYYKDILFKVIDPPIDYCQRGKYVQCFVRRVVGNWGMSHYQVEATTGKRPMLTKGTRLFSRVTKCTVITARPDLTGIYKNNILILIFCFYCLVLYKCEYRRCYSITGYVNT